MSLPKVDLVFDQKTTPWIKASDEEPLLFKKELMYAGEFAQADGLEFAADELLFQHWADTHQKLKANGIKVPLPLGHTDDPEANRGEIVDVLAEPNEAGVPACFVVAKFRDAEAARLAASTDVSAYSPAHWRDGKKNDYVRPLRHVALTDYPIVPGLGGFKAIAASHVMKEAPMPLTDLAKKLGLTAEEDKAEEAIVASFETVNAKLTDATSELEKKDAEIAALKAKVPSDPVTVTASHRTMLRDNRELKLDRLIGEKISPAVAVELKKIFCTDDSLNLVLSHENGDDKFDRVLKALEMNETVSLSQGTPPQGGALQKTNDGNPNPLVEDAKRRAEAAKN